VAFVFVRTPSWYDKSSGVPQNEANALFSLHKLHELENTYATAHPVLIVSAVVFLTASPAGLTPRFGTSQSRGAENSSEDYFYCVLADGSQSKRTFFTGVFSGDKSEQPTLETKFSSYVSAKYRGVHGSAVCHFDKSRSVATMRLKDDKIAAANQENRAVIETNWRP
jgi:hypothetical protein